LGSTGEGIKATVEDL